MEEDGEEEEEAAAAVAGSTGTVFCRCANPTMYCACAFPPLAAASYQRKLWNGSVDSSLDARSNWDSVWLRRAASFSQ